jgi:hypothetical protein
MSNWLPPLWFTGLFEVARGAPNEMYLTLARRAVIGTAIAVAAAIGVSIVGFRRQMQLALAPATLTRATAGPARWLARLLAGRDRAARAASDFVVLTLTRNRIQQTYIAINAAVGATIVIAALTRSFMKVAAIAGPRVSLLWIPLVMAYWIGIGLRAAFFMPAELPASWTFRMHAPRRLRATWSAVRGALISFVAVPAAALGALVAVPFFGWVLAAQHATFVLVLTTLYVELIALTVPHLPFTRAYEPGHAKLKTRWWVYLFGLFVFAYWPVRIEVAALSDPVLYLELVGVPLAAIAVVEIAARRRRPIDAQHAQEDDVASDDITVLDIAFSR